MTRSTVLLVALAFTGAGLRGQVDAASSAEADQLLADLVGDNLAARRRALAAMAGNSSLPGLEAGLVRVLLDEKRFPGPDGDEGCITLIGGRPPKFRPRRGLIEPRELRWKTRPPYSGVLRAAVIEDDYDLYYRWSPRTLAAYAIGRLDRCSESTIQALVDVIDNGGCAAGEAWGALLRHREPALPTIVAAFEKSPESVLRDLLGEFGEAVRPYLAGWIAADNKVLRYHAGRLALRVGLATAALRVYRDQLLGLPAESESAAVWLADSGAAAVPVLLAGLQHEKMHVRMHAAAALALVRAAPRSDAAPPFPITVVDELIELAKVEEKSPAHWALRALGRVDLGVERRDAVRKILLDKMESELAIQREIACVHFGAMPGLADEPVQARLKRWRNAPTRAVAHAAYRALAAIAERGEKGELPLSIGLAAQIRAALAKRPGSSRRRELVELADQANDIESLRAMAKRQWRLAIDCLFRRGDDSPETIEFLKRRWRGAEGTEREGVLENAIRMPARLVVPMAVSVVEDPEAKPYVKAAAAKVLAAHGALADYSDVLVDLLASPSGTEGIADALVTLPRKHLRRHRARVFELLSHESLDVRQAAARVARRIEKGQ